MNNKNDKIEKLYSSDFYIKKNPSLHEEDSVWKVEKIKPLIDKFIKTTIAKKIKLLDIGGGAGVILKLISLYIEKEYGITVEKNILDLSPGMLKIQKQNNPDIKKILNENIEKTTLKNKEIDLVLMIDVLEHVNKPTLTLKEISRVSKYAIFKVPLDNNLLYIFWNFIKRSKPKQNSAETMGHINFYNYYQLKKIIEKHCGKIIFHNFTNSSKYYLNSKKHQNKMSGKIKILRQFGRQFGNIIFQISPYFSSLILNDFAVILVKCY